MKKFSSYLKNGIMAVALFAGVSVATVAVTAPLAHADHTPTHSVQGGVNAIGGNEDGRRAGAFTNLLESIINILLFIIGAIAVIMIIIGGIKYTTSNGDQAQVTSAKNTILYAIVGLVVAIMAYAIVNFVVDKL